MTKTLFLSVLLGLLCATQAPLSSATEVSGTCVICSKPTIEAYMWTANHFCHIEVMCGTCSRMIQWMGCLSGTFRIQNLNLFNYNLKTQNKQVRVCVGCLGIYQQVSAIGDERWCENCIRIVSCSVCGRLGTSAQPLYDKNAYKICQNCSTAATAK